MDNQLKLFKKIQKSGVNMVTCGSCGDVLLHDIRDVNITCPHCSFNSEPCDFPDFYYESWKNDIVGGE